MQKQPERVGSACVSVSSSSGCRAAQTRCWSTRCWRRSGAWHHHTWWWPWWGEMSWHRWSPGSGTRWEKDWWRLRRAQVTTQPPGATSGNRFCCSELLLLLSYSLCLHFIYSQWSCSMLSNFFIVWCPWASERCLYVKCILIICNCHESNGTYINVDI